MIFSQRDLETLRLLCWCQYVQQEDLNAVSSATEQEHLIFLGLVRQHRGSGALTLSNNGRTLLQDVFEGNLPQLSQSYHGDAIQRRIRLSRMALTAYRGSVDIFTTETGNMITSPSLFLSAVSRSRGSNPWGSTRIAAIAHLGDALHAIHYVCSGIGKIALTDELTAFTNQTARFRNARRAFIFAGESYTDILTALEQTSRMDTKLPVLVNFCLDEYCNIGYMDGIADALNSIRGFPRGWIHGCCPRRAS